MTEREGTSGRAKVLADIRDAVRRSPLGGPGEEGDRSSSGGARPIPARGRVAGEARVALFIEQATAVEATVERLDAAAGVPGAAAAYLDEAGLEPALAVHGDLRDLDWAAAGIRPAGDPADEERPALLPAFAGVAETGSICLTSDEAPLRAAFLPETLVAVLREDDLVGHYEALWERGREVWGGELPASLVLVAGPSRTADIQQSLVLGAHGPRRLHVLLVAGPGS